MHYHNFLHCENIIFFSGFIKHNLYPAKSSFLAVQFFKFWLTNTVVIPLFESRSWVWNHVRETLQLLSLFQGTPFLGFEDTKLRNTQFMQTDLIKTLCWESGAYWGGLQLPGYKEIGYSFSLTTQTHLHQYFLT